MTKTYRFEIKVHFEVEAESEEDARNKAYDLLKSEHALDGRVDPQAALDYAKIVGVEDDWRDG
jgi:hypothetical protein